MSLVAAPATADMNLKQMQIASGLAEIIKNAKPCRYTVDQASLEKYYLASELANAEVLAYIAGLISLSEYDNPPTDTDCTMAKVTAKTIGILAE